MHLCEYTVFAQVGKKEWNRIHYDATIPLPFTVKPESLYLLWKELKQ